MLIPFCKIIFPVELLIDHFSHQLLIYIVKRLVLKYISHSFISMFNEEKIEIAEKRITELKILINHWKTSNISSRKATVDFVEAILSDRQDSKAA